MRCDRSTRDCCDRRRSLPSSSFPYPCSEYSFYLCRKGVCSSWLKERKEFYFYNALCRERNPTNHTFGSLWRRKLSPHFLCVVVRTPAGLKHTNTHKHTFDDREYNKDGEEDEREEIADGWWCCCCCSKNGETETLHEHGKQNERKRARELAKKRGDRETIENVQTTTDKR